MFFYGGAVSELLDHLKFHMTGWLKTTIYSQLGVYVSFPVALDTAAVEEALHDRLGPRQPDNILFPEGYSLESML